MVLLKGTSLTLDLYPEAVFRDQEDLDLLVEPRRQRSTLEAAREAGLVMDETQFPFWWYRLVHFHVQVRPAVSLLTMIELHWRLQSPALLLTIPPDRLWSRVVEVAVGPDLGTFMLVGVQLPEPGCWRLTARYEDARLSYVVWVVEG